MALIEARRSPDRRGAFVLLPPPGWSGVREQRVERGAPYEVPALCPAHRPDVRILLSRSLSEIAERVRNTTGERARAVAVRALRCTRAIEKWNVVPPTQEQLTAMSAVVAELRAELGLPPGFVTGVRRAARTPDDQE